MQKEIYKCYEPSKKKTTGPRQNYFQLVEDNSEFSVHDIVWAVLKTLSPSLSAKIPTWAAYNSLLASAPVSTTVAMFPVSNGSPTIWENQYTAMKEAEKIRKHIYKDGKTIISFDLQLYIKAIMIQQRPDIQSGFLFRMGELHVVFCAFKIIGKLIDGRGLDQTFDEAGMRSLSNSMILEFTLLSPKYVLRP